MISREYFLRKSSHKLVRNRDSNIMLHIVALDER